MNKGFFSWENKIILKIDNYDFHSSNIIRTQIVTMCNQTAYYILFDLVLLTQKYYPSSYFPLIILSVLLSKIVREKAHVNQCPISFFYYTHEPDTQIDLIHSTIITKIGSFL